MLSTKTFHVIELFFYMWKNILEESGKCIYIYKKKRETCKNI